MVACERALLIAVNAGVSRFSLEIGEVPHLLADDVVALVKHLRIRLQVSDLVVLGEQRVVDGVQAGDSVGTVLGDDDRNVAEPINLSVEFL